MSHVNPQPADRNSPNSSASSAKQPGITVAVATRNGTPSSIPGPIVPDAELLAYLNQAPSVSLSNNSAAPTKSVNSTLRVDAAHAMTPPRGAPIEQIPAPASMNPGLLERLQQWRTTITQFVSSPKPTLEDSGSLPHRPLHERHRFNSDPRDDVRLRWADELPEWWHFDIEARMVERETLWITEQLEALFLKYLKPVWWDRFVEGIQDFLATVRNELLQPAWAVLTAPFRALAALIPDIDWPWNFELRGPNVSVKQNPFRRMVFDSHLASQVVEHLWSDPDEFLEAGHILSRDDQSVLSRVPVKAPQRDGHFERTAVGQLKRFNLRGVIHTLTRVLLFTRGSRSWTYGRELLNTGIATPRPLAMVEDRIGPFRFRSFVLTESIEGTPLPEFLARTSLTTLELDRLAGQFARIWHTLGELRLVHGQMQAQHFVVTADRRLVLTNLESTWRHWFDITFLHRRDRDWLRFSKTWRGQPEIAAAFRAAVARHDEELLTKQTALPNSRPLQLQRAA